MARPKKEGFEYFPVDVDIFSDIGVRLSMMRYGAQGFALYLYLLARIYDNGFWLRFEEELAELTAWELHMEASSVREILAFFLQKGLFDRDIYEKENILTSRGVQRRYQAMMKKRLRRRTMTVPKALWLLSESETESYLLPADPDEAPCAAEAPANAEEASFEEETDENPEEMPKNHFCTNNGGFSANNATKQSKAKQSKVKQSKAKQSVCAASVLQVPCRGGTAAVTSQELETYTHTYPHIDVLNSLQKAALYLQAHPEKQRSRSATGAYLKMWLEEDERTRASCLSSAPASPHKKPTYDISEYESFNAVDAWCAAGAAQ